MIVDLKPCPFCGWKAELLPHHIVACESCGGCVDTVEHTTDMQAIEAWNARAERTCRNSTGTDGIDKMFFTCSVCGHSQVNGTYPREWLESEHTDEEAICYDGEQFNYCPHCGARVIGGEE